MMSAEPSTSVSSGNAKRATTMLLTRKMSSPSKLNTVSRKSPVTRVAIFMYCHALQDVGGKAAVKPEMINNTPAKELMAINLTDNRTVR